MKTRIVLALAMFLFSGGAVLADETASPRAQQVPVDPAAVKAARELIDATNASSNTMLIIDAITPAVMQSIKQAKPDLPDDVLKQFSTTFREEMQSSLPQMLDMEAKVYAAHFSIEELRGLAKFYESDLGKKTIQELPKILKETIPLGQAWGRSAGEAAMQRTIEKLRAQGVKI